MNKRWLRNAGAIVIMLAMMAIAMFGTYAGISCEWHPVLIVLNKHEIIVEYDKGIAVANCTRADVRPGDDVRIVTDIQSSGFIVTEIRHQE